jgi:hypothetical protein
MRFLLFACVLLAGGAGQAFGYVRTMADTGRPLFWVSPSLHLYANPVNASGLSEADVSSQLAAAFSSWSNVSGSSASISLSESTGYPAVSNYDGVNAVYFATNGGRAMDGGVVALTEVLYYVDTGQIVEADMSFNDYDYKFTSHEGDTGRYIGGKYAVYLQDVATHEAGHVFGLDHSLVNLSSLIYTAFSGQYSLSDDDKTAIRTVYPSGSGNGALEGTVTGTKGGIFGTHVEAINLGTGAIQAGALANPDGSFRIGDIPPGQYAVLMEPFASDIYSVSSYYQNVNHHFCSGSMFRRTFYGPCGSSAAAVVAVDSGRNTSLGVLAPSCDQMGNPEGAPTTLATAQDFPVAGGARFGTLSPGGTHYYRLNGASGSLKVKALSYSLYSPIDIQVDVLDENGDPLAGAVSVDNVQDPMPGGYINYDASAEASLSGGVYYLRVQASPTRLYSSVFPAGFDLLDASGHYLLAASIDDAFGPSATADMSACVSVANRAQSATYRAPASTTGGNKKTKGGCGSLHSSGSPWNGGAMQLFLFAALVHLFLLARRLKAALVRRRR